MKEVKTQEYRVWRDPMTKEITRKEPTRTCLISPNDIDSMNRQNFGNSIHGGGEHYYEAIPEEIKGGFFYKDLPQEEISEGLDWRNITRTQIIEAAKRNDIKINDRDKKDDILISIYKAEGEDKIYNQIKEQC